MMPKVIIVTRLSMEEEGMVTLPHRRIRLEKTSPACDVAEGICRIWNWTSPTYRCQNRTPRTRAVHDV